MFRSFQTTTSLFGGFKPHIVIPDYKIYKVGEHTPELLEVQQKLAAKGLKDPWLRNEVWRYDMANRYGFTRNKALLYLVQRGFIPGLILASVSTVLWKAWESSQPHDDHH